MLGERTWKLKYTPDDGDLVKLFYVPALKDAERYDRLTGYFNAQALTLAVRGIEGLVRNGGRMRLVAGCTLEPPEIEAIEKGEQLRDLVERHLTNLVLSENANGAARSNPRGVLKTRGDQPTRHWLCDRRPRADLSSRPSVPSNWRAPNSYAASRW